MYRDCATHQKKEKERERANDTSHCYASPGWVTSKSQPCVHNVLLFVSPWILCSAMIINAPYLPCTLNVAIIV